MRLADFFTRTIRHADLIEQMLEKTGVEQALEALPGHAGVMRRAANRCLGCGQADACESWLKTADGPASAPDYCRNHDLIERISLTMEAEPAA